MMAFPLSEHAGQLRRAHRSPANARQRLFHVSGGRARTQSIARPPSQASPRPETPPREGLTHRHAQAGVPAGAHEAEARLLLRPLGTLPRAQHAAAAAAALPPHHRDATPQRRRRRGRGRARSNLIHTQVGTAHQHRVIDIRNPTHNNETTNEHCAHTPPRGKVTYKDGRAPAARAQTQSPQPHTQVGTAHQNRAVNIRNPTHNNGTTSEHCACTHPRGKITYKDGCAPAARAQTQSPQPHTQVGTAHQNRAVYISYHAHNNSTTNEHCARTAPCAGVRDGHARGGGGGGGRKRSQEPRPNPTHAGRQDARYSQVRRGPPQTKHESCARRNAGAGERARGGQGARRRQTHTRTQADMMNAAGRPPGRPRARHDRRGRLHGHRTPREAMRENGGHEPDTAHAPRACKARATSLTATHGRTLVPIGRGTLTAHAIPTHCPPLPTLARAVQGPVGVRGRPARANGPSRRAMCAGAGLLE